MGAWIFIICKCHICTDENIILKHNSIPQLNPALYRYTITDPYIILNKTMRTNITICAYGTVRQHYTKLPDIGGIRYGIVLTVG